MQGESKNKIVWPDIEFIASAQDCLRAYAYHRRDRCRGATPVRMAGFSIPGIHRYRVLVDGKKVADEAICIACGVKVGRSASQRLEKGQKHVVEIPFGSRAKNVRTDYYLRLSRPYDLESAELP